MTKPLSELHAWHTAALAGVRQPVHHTEVHCGWYKRKLIRGGAWVAVLISMDGERMDCLVNGEFDAKPIQQWTHCCDHPITEDEYLYLLKLRRWARAHAPDHPASDPGKKIDLLRVPLPF